MEGNEGRVVVAAGIVHGARRLEVALASWE